MHPFQISILRELLFKPNARFSDLKKMDIPNDHFSFHLKALQDRGLIEKTTTGYQLSQKGKQVSNLIDTDTITFEKQAKLSIALHAMRYTDGQLETLCHQRLKHPYYGWWGSHSGKIRFGESPLECAQREFLEETGLTGTFEHKAILHWIDSSPTGEILEDKYFFVYFVSDTKGELKTDLEEGKNKWVNEQEFKSFEHTFGSWDSLMEEYESKQLFFREVRKTRTSY